MTKALLTPLPKPTRATLTVPGSKSYTNRALIMAAMTPANSAGKNGVVRIVNPLLSDDTEAMLACLKTFGIKVKVNLKEIIVLGDVSEVKNKQYLLDAWLSGTTMRFILALSCVVPGVKIITGQKELCQRPIGELVSALRQLGAEIIYLDKEGYPPVKVTSSKLNAGIATLCGDVSSQYFSALMMIAPFIGQLTIKVKDKQISSSYIDMTIDMMKEWGVNVRNNHYKSYVIKGGQNYKIDRYVVEGDFSGAGYFFAIAALTGSTFTLKNLNPRTKQGDFLFVKILKEMGNRVSFGKDQITIKGQGVKPVNVDMTSCPDQAQTLAVLTAFAKGETKIRGIGSLRVKETERVIAIERELKKMGIATQSTKDTLTIYGGKPHSAVIETYGDHRMAMSFAVAGSVLSGMEICEPEVVNKTFPEFWEKLKQVGVGVLSVGRRL